MNDKFNDNIDKAISDIENNKNVYPTGRVTKVNNYNVEVTGLNDVAFYEAVSISDKADGYVMGIYPNKIIISLDDLSDRQREIAEVIGIENYIKLSKRFGGEDSVYIQKYSEIIKSVRNKEIRKKYNDGHNISELAKIYNLSIFASCAIIKFERNTFLEIIPL